MNGTFVGSSERTDKRTFYRRPTTGPKRTLGLINGPLRRPFTGPVPCTLAIPNQRVQTLRRPALCVQVAEQFVGPSTTRSPRTSGRPRVGVEQSAHVKSKANHASWNGGAGGPLAVQGGSRVAI